MFKSLFKPRAAVAAGQALYAGAVAQARMPALYSDLGAPDTVMGRFELYTLHVVLLVRRLKGEGAQASETTQALFDAYLSGLDIALREMGVGDLSVGKKMKKLGRAFYGRVKAYENALEAQSPDALQALITRTVFEGEGDAAPLARYVVESAARLSGQPLENLLGGDRWMERLCGMNDPWTASLRLGEIGNGLQRHIEPTSDERRRIAKTLDLVELASLEADFDLKPWFDGAQIGGSWRAVVVQTCGVTLERLETPLSGSFDLKVVTPDSPHAPTLEAQLTYDPEADEPPDVLEGDVIDLAAYAVEHLALEIDPFPRKPGVEFVPPDMGPEPSPFDVLRKLKTDGQ